MTQEMHIIVAGIIVSALYNMYFHLYKKKKNTISQELDDWEDFFRK